MKEVKVTVLMPAYNAAKYIAEAIRSVLEQTFTDFELLIINDGSTDETVSVIRKFTDSRIRLVEQARQGVSVALNKGLQEATGYYIARFDADDICFPQRLQRQVSFLDNNPGYVLTGCDAEYIAENGEYLFTHHCAAYTNEEIIRQINVYCPFIHSGVMYRKKAALEAGSYSSDIHNIEDHLLWIRMAKFGYYCNLPEQLIKVRFNPDSATIDEKWRGRDYKHLRRNIILRGSATKEEADKLKAIIEKQDTKKLKNGAYHALCGKKFLLDNHQPFKARFHFAKAIHLYPFRPDNYAFYFLSFFPGSFIKWLHEGQNKF